MTRDLDASVKFCNDVFGWTAETMEFDGFSYTVMANDGQPTCGAMAMPPMMPAEVPSHWVVNFAVSDCDKAAAYVSANGGTVTSPANDTPFGRACSVMDPWGAVLNVIDRSTATAQ